MLEPVVAQDAQSRAENERSQIQHSPDVENLINLIQDYTRPPVTLPLERDSGSTHPGRSFSFSITGDPLSAIHPRRPSR